MKKNLFILLALAILLVLTGCPLFDTKTATVKIVNDINDTFTHSDGSKTEIDYTVDVKITGDFIDDLNATLKNGESKSFELVWNDIASENVTLHITQYIENRKEISATGTINYEGDTIYLDPNTEGADVKEDIGEVKNTDDITVTIRYAELDKFEYSK